MGQPLTQERLRVRLGEPVEGVLVADPVLLPQPRPPLLASEGQGLGPDRVVPAQRAPAGDHEQRVRHQVRGPRQQVLQQAGPGGQRLHGLERVEVADRRRRLLRPDLLDVPGQQNRQVPEHLVWAGLVQDHPERPEVVADAADRRRLPDPVGQAARSAVAQLDHGEAAEYLVEDARDLAGGLLAVLLAQEAAAPHELAEADAGVLELPVDGQAGVERGELATQPADGGAQPQHHGLEAEVAVVGEVEADHHPARRSPVVVAGQQRAEPVDQRRLADPAFTVHDDDVVGRSAEVLQVVDGQPLTGQLVGAAQE